MDILIDTNVYAGFKRNQRDAVEIIQQADSISINTVVLGEILCGILSGSKKKRNLEELNEFLDSTRVKMIEIDEKTAYFYSEIYKNLKESGAPIPTNDMWITATAMRHGLTLVSYDKHFSHVPGIIWLNPLNWEV